MPKYYAGCPVWGRKDWVGMLFRRGIRTGDYLHEYAGIFNAVEGNTTFYGVPSSETINRWRDAVGPDFRFCFKFPRLISHDQRLNDVDRQVGEFLETIAPLGQLVGPVMLQLPPSLSGNQMDLLSTFLAKLPGDFRYAVECRHLDYFEDRPHAVTLTELLIEFGIDRVILDARTLHAAPETGEEVRLAKQKKPNLPIPAKRTGRYPIIRYIGDPEVDSNRESLGAWAQCFSQWIREGATPFFFAHMPNDHYAPNLVRLFHDLLRHLEPDIEALPDWPGHVNESEQLSLF
ncbi:MAG: DUF72 domain-containing protein [Candidatus Latescibacteria bacterium]|jgi:uncharacterized protein YecE (DUF72 family)|nr:DUF72 domain-containing protein [Candidatus Latescibacterota bacterium]